MFIEVGRLLERAVQWLLRSSYEKLDIAAYVAEFRPRIQTLAARLSEVLPATLLSTLNTRRLELEASGIPTALAQRVASLHVMSAALDIVRLTRAGRPVDDVARV